MQVIPARMFGQGVEFICRCRADGSFVRRYGAYIEKGEALDYFVEATLKDDERADPPITKDALELLGIMSAAEYEVCKSLTQEITKLIAADLQAHSLELYDIKFEFGRNDDGIMLIDEISGGSMRVYKDGIPLPPMEIGQHFLI